MPADDSIRLEVLKLTPKRIPRARLQELAAQLAPGGSLPVRAKPAHFWAYRSTEVYLDPTHHTIHSWAKKQADYQLILWRGEEAVAELWGFLYPDQAIVAGIHSDIKGGGTRLMRAFAKIAAHRPVHLDAIKRAVGFYEHLGFQLRPTPQGREFPMVWEPQAQAAAAEMA